MPDDRKTVQVKPEQLTFIPFDYRASIFLSRLTPHLSRFFYLAPNSRTMTPLTKAQQETCAYTGIFGVMLGATCLIQLFIITRQHWISAALIVVTILTMISFILLALQKYYAPAVLIVSGALVLVNNAVIIMLGVVSLIAVIYLAYIVVIVTILFMGEYPQRMKAMALAKRQEEREWEGKI